MNFNKPVFFLLIIFLISLSYNCQTKTGTLSTKSIVPVVPVNESATLTRIAIGSCNRSDLAQPLWEPIMAKNPDLWIWLGDNVYGDTEDMEKLAANYQRQKSNMAYQKLLAVTPVIGIWDDHDYGVNDGGKEYPKRSESRDILLNFLDVPKSNPVWQREGAYQSYTFGEGNKKVKVILLDARYFRDPVERRRGQNPQYIPNKTGTILGAAQWQWLEQELKNSDAQIHLIGSGIQILPTMHNYEKWNTFPQEREKLFGLLTKYKVPGTILMSGDRHIGELSSIDIEGLDYPLVELTTSGLTHVYKNASEENDLRIGNLVNKLNFGFFEIDWTKSKPMVKMEISGENGKIYQTHRIDFRNGK